MSDRTIKALREQLDEARETIRQLRELEAEKCPPLVGIAGLTKMEAKFAHALVVHGKRSYDQMHFVMYGDVLELDRPADTNIVPVFACKTRKKLRAFGIEFNTLWGVGYEMTRENAAKLRALAELPVVESPNIQATIAEMAA